MTGEGPSLVAALTDHDLDKYSLLEKVLEGSRFFEILEERRLASGKDRKDFRIAVKPNLSMMLRRSDVGTYADPFLLVHLLRLLLGRGYENLVVVESGNLYGNWFKNRWVLQVAARAGLLDEAEFDSLKGRKSAAIRVRGGGVDARVPIVDLSLDMVEHDIGPPAGPIALGRTWIEADFRIGLAKMKTHFYALYTLTIKNIYGCLPVQDKVRAYHCRKVVGRWTARMIRDFPVHFSIVDGYSAADGWLGVKMKAICLKPHTLLAGADIQAVEHYGARLIHVRAERSVLYHSLAKIVPPRPYRAVGNAVPVRPWRKSPALFALACRVIESSANIMDFAGSLATGGHDDCFPPSRSTQGPLSRALYYLSLPANLLSDVDFIKLRLRERVFFHRIRKLGDQMPLLAGSPFVLARLAFLAPADLSALIEIVESGGFDQASFSGHYLFIDDREVPFPARFSPANIAAVEILNHLKQNGWDPSRFVEELKTLLDAYPVLFPGLGLYPYCYA